MLSHNRDWRERVLSAILLFLSLGGVVVFILALWLYPFPVAMALTAGWAAAIALVGYSLDRVRMRTLPRSGAHRRAAYQFWEQFWSPARQIEERIGPVVTVAATLGFFAYMALGAAENAFSRVIPGVLALAVVGLIFAMLWARHRRG